MAKDTGNAASVQQDRHSPEDVDNHVASAPWRILFFFTTKQDLPILSVGVSTSLIGGLYSPASSRVTGALIETFTKHATGATTPTEFFDRAKTLIVYLVAIAGLAWLTDTVDFACWLAFGERQARSSRDRLFRALLDRDMAWYDTRPNGIGALLPRLQAQTRDLQLATAQPLGSLVVVLATAALSLVQAFSISWSLTLVTLASAPIFMVLIMWAGRSSQDNLAKKDGELATAQKFSTSAFSAIETVKCFNGQEAEAEKYSKAVYRAARWYHRVAHANAIEMALFVLLSISMFVQGFYYGGVLIRNGSISVADVVTTFLSAVNAFIALSAILPQMIVLEKGRAAGASLKEIVDSKDAASRELPAARRNSTANFNGDVCLKNVSFAYPSRPQHRVLTDVNMHVPGGETVFVVGRSGCGKSTIGQLLMDFYATTDGKITIGGHAIEDLDTESLRSNITLVEQTSTLFNDTIQRNVALGGSIEGENSREQVLEAIEFALLQQQLNDMPAGVETQLGSRGDAASGGQRQRIALARARLRDTQILILDECTSALDVISRALMMDAIRQWRRGKTTIIITHDIAQILPGDYVYVMNDGRVMQEGYRKHLDHLKEGTLQALVPTVQTAMDGSTDAHDNSTVDQETASKILTQMGTPTKQPVHQSAREAIDKRRYTCSPRLLTSSTLRDKDTFFGHTIPIAVPTLDALAMGPPLPVYKHILPASSNGLPVHFDPLRQKGPHEPQNFHGRGELDWQTTDEIIEKAGSMAAASRAKRRSTIRAHSSSVVVSSSAESQSGTKRSLFRITSRPRREEPVGIQHSLKDIMSVLWPHLNSNQRLALLGGFWACTLHGFSSPVFSYVLSKLIATYSSPNSAHASLVYTLIMLGLAFADSMATYLYRLLLEYAGQAWVDNVRAEAMKRILDQPRTFFHDDENTVTCLSDGLDRNGEEMRNLLGRFCGLAYIAAILVSVSVIWAMTAQWKVTVIVLASGSTVLISTKIFAVVSNKWEGLSNDASELTSAIFTETITNVKTVRAFTLEKYFFEKYTISVKDALKIGYKRSVYSGLCYGLSASSGSFVIALMFYVGAWQVKNGDATVGKVVQVFLQLMFAVTNLGSILNYIPQISSSTDSASRLLRLAQLPANSHEHRGDFRLQEVGDIVCKDLSFSYPSRPSQTILNRLNLTIEQGTCIAIVGGSGSGKSTLASLLLNLYTSSPSSSPLPSKTSDLKSPALTISNHPIDEISTQTLRNHIAIVPQTPVLFPGTIHENITYGLPRTSPLAKPAAVISAAHQSGIHTFIASLPLCYNTLIGAGGVALSGGQAQRLAIARALVRRPSVLILDEATSALDGESAGRIRETIKVLVEGRAKKENVMEGQNGSGEGLTVVIITHAREMMEISDKIVVMDEGKIVQHGRFEELKEVRGGALARMLSGGEWNIE